jgi:hypothetical protein
MECTNRLIYGEDMIKYLENLGFERTSLILPSKLNDGKVVAYFKNQQGLSYAIRGYKNEHN